MWYADIALAVCCGFVGAWINQYVPSKINRKNTIAELELQLGVIKHNQQVAVVFLAFAIALVITANFVK